ncbi:hypothetical protein OF001_U230068 [Pseudomonas sp. OF001]|nr:hypothetical protein OF001_U230068 [Pseudomonas sp. OF001]
MAADGSCPRRAHRVICAHRRVRQNNNKWRRHERSHPDPAFPPRRECDPSGQSRIPYGAERASPSTALCLSGGAVRSIPILDT